MSETARDSHIDRLVLQSQDRMSSIEDEPRDHRRPWATSQRYLGVFSSCRRPKIHKSTAAVAKLTTLIVR